MDAQREARKLADELEQTGLALDDDVGADLLQKAAEIRAVKLQDLTGAAAVLRQALQRHPAHVGLIERALQIAVEAEDHAEQADLLGLAVKVATRPDAKARLLAKRGDVVGLGLGRIAEARGLYRDAARLTSSTELKGTLEAVLLKIELHLESRGQGSAGAPVWSPTCPGAVEIDARKAVTSDSLAEYRARLAERAEIDEPLLFEAVRFGIRNNVIGIASRLLPELRVEARVELLEQLAIGAEGVGDQEAALDLRVTAIEDSLTIRPYEVDLEDLLDHDQRPRLYARYLRARARHADDWAEKKAFYAQSQRRAEAAADLEGAAEAVLESLRLPGLGEDLERLLATADRLSLESRDRTVLTRALGAAAAHQELAPERRARLLSELANILELELGDRESALAVRAELRATPEPRIKDTMMDQPGPLLDFGGEPRSWAEVVETIPPPEPEPLIEVPALAVSVDPTEPLMAPSIPGPDAALEALAAGDLVGALFALEGSQVGEPILWIRAGRLALDLLQPKLGEKAFTKALELTKEGPLRQQALLGAELSARRLGASKEVARLAAERVTTFEDRADHPGGKMARQKALLLVADAFVRARRRDEARGWLVRAVEVEPTAEALSAWLRLAGDDGDPGEIERVWSKVDLGRFAGPARADLLLARAGALVAQGDGAGAVTLYQQALGEDPQVLRPAEELLALGIGEANDRVIDLALEALRARALLAGEANRAFLAAGCRVARGGAPQLDRATYEAGRIALYLRPKNALSEGWLAEWLGLFGDNSESSVEGTEIRPELELQPAERAALGDVEAAFGESGVVLVAATGDRVELRDRTPARIGIPTSLRGRARRLRFELGRVLAAVTEPRLAGALANPSPAGATPQIAELVLDRAGLVVGGDPALALEAVGARTPRGLRLLAFATSKGLVELWGRLGIGVQERPSLTKPHFVT